MIPVVTLLLISVQSRSADRTHDITTDDYFSLASIAEVAVSPDGKYVAYGQTSWDKSDDGRKTDLWIVAANGQTPPRRLTFDRANDRHFRWGASGDVIYFLGNRKRAAETKPPYDGSAQVWSIQLVPTKADSHEGPQGLQPQAVTRVEGGVTGYDYASSAGAIFYSTDTTATTNDDFAHLRSQFNKVEYGHGNRSVSQIHKLDLTTWRSEKLVDDHRYIREFAVTRDGNRIAMISAFDDSVEKSEGESRVDVWEFGKTTTPPTDPYRKNAASPHAWLESLAWSPDGNHYAFCAIFDAYPAEIVVGSKAGGEWETRLIKRPAGVMVHGYGSPLKWTSSDTLRFLREKAGRVNVANALPETSAEDDLQDRVVSAFDTDPSGRTLAIVAGTGKEFADLFVSDSTDALMPPTRPVHLNVHASTWKLPTAHHITWKAPDGTSVGGVLELPYGYKKGDKLPLVVAIHGGPTTSTTDDLSFQAHNGRVYFAAAGYAVLLPNYRGSTGYGDKFVIDLVGNENDIEVKNIVAGVQHLIKEGIADADRVGVMGWSNGGFLTNCLITLKDPPVQFRAASSGGSIVDTVAEWGFNDEPAYPEVFKKGRPWDQPTIYHKTSPTFGLGNVTTPTLIHVGGSDPRCPPGHSRMLFRALNEYHQVATELVVYTGEPHGLTKMSNQKAKIEWDLAWFAKYMKGK
jgi:dipeptidyl aminopeptidase/acylaminoacyl peptidase